MGLNDEREKLKLAGIWLHTYAPGDKYYDAAYEHVFHVLTCMAGECPQLREYAQSIADSIGGVV